ncbi:hypothetical protein P730_19385 [Salmonella enterica subsp. enterica serovar Enteritidis str. SHSE004]|uniref:hypothetical protein n=1 Tax=Pseudomonadota TaxID=1224 RepID=UPI000B91C0AD|nr:MULTISPECIES: hypothetical protein [Pseudomonadota]MBN9357542.1 hypothetical protein [Herbaspirillum huttiense]OXY50508.1 hypothetical protein P730_19385 [Salmonella enterica subsp. enterica serovar Enteritidis str. SHSE004]
MSKALSGGGGGSNDILLLGIVVIGAMMFSRTARAQQQTAPRTVYVPASASGASGTGAAQIAGGIAGGLAAWLGNLGAAAGSINTNPGNGYDTWNGTATVQNSFGLYGPIGGTAEDPWYG